MTQTYAPHEHRPLTPEYDPARGHELSPMFVPQRLQTDVYEGAGYGREAPEYDGASAHDRKHFRIEGIRVPDTREVAALTADGQVVLIRKPAPALTAEPEAGRQEAVPGTVVPLSMARSSHRSDEVAVADILGIIGATADGEPQELPDINPWKYSSQRMTVLGVKLHQTAAELAGRTFDDGSELVTYTEAEFLQAMADGEVTVSGAETLDLPESPTAIQDSATEAIVSYAFMWGHGYDPSAVRRSAAGGGKGWRAVVSALRPLWRRYASFQRVVDKPVPNDYNEDYFPRSHNGTVVVNTPRDQGQALVVEREGHQPDGEFKGMWFLVERFYAQRDHRSKVSVLGRAALAMSKLLRDGGGWGYAYPRTGLTLASGSIKWHKGMDTLSTAEAETREEMTEDGKMGMIAVPDTAGLGQHTDTSEEDGVLVRGKRMGARQLTATSTVHVLRFTGEYGPTTGRDEKRPEETVPKFVPKDDIWRHIAEGHVTDPSAVMAIIRFCMRSGLTFADMAAGKVPK